MERGKEILKTRGGDLMFFIKKYRFESITITSFAVVFIMFCNYYMIELPHLTWFDQIPLIEKFYTGTMTFADLLTRYGEHGMLGTNLLFLMNTVMFRMSTMFDVYLNDLNVTVMACVLVASIRKSFSEDKRGWTYKICVVLASFFAFNILQGSSGAMETQVRLGMLFSILAMAMCDRVLMENVTTQYLVGTICVIIISVNVFGTLYCFAAVPAICLFVLGRAVHSKRIVDKNMLLFTTFVLTWICYIFQYQLLAGGSVSSSGIFQTVAAIIRNPSDVITSFIGFCGSFVLGYPALADHRVSEDVYLIVGFFVCLTLIWGIYRFFKSGLYKRTMLPLLLISYTFFVWVLVIIGRYDQADNAWQWMTNFWYFVHTKVALVGVGWIIGYDLMHCSDKKKLAGAAAMIFLLCLAIFGNILEFMRVPHEKTYYQEKQPYLFAETMEQLPVDLNGNTPLLHSPEMTMQSIEILKKYNLSVYCYYDSFEKMRTMVAIDLTQPGVEGKTGVYEDGWVAPNASISIRSGEENVAVLKGYYPGEITGDQIINIYIDDMLVTSFIISSPEFEIPFEIESNSNTEVHLESNFTVLASAPDIRELSFILADIALKS